MKYAALALAACVIAGVLQASERALADSLAATGATLAAKGNTAGAREMFYKALANDENCPDAIFELAKIFDKENSTAAASDFYQRASLIYSQENKPNTTAKRAEAEKRLRTLNPFAPRMAGLYEDYAQDLDRLVKKVPDTVTQDAALARVNELKMSSVLAPEKLPKFYASAQAERVAATEAEKKPARSTNGFTGAETPTPKVTKVAPDVERELKALGWTTITGVWVKKGPNLYEVTDGKLEVAKTTGGVDVWVVKGGSGTVKATVRDDYNKENNTGGFFSEYTGYGVAVSKRDCRFYPPGAYSGFTFNSKYEPSYARSEMIPEANPKNHFTVMIGVDNVLEMMFNERKVIRFKDDKLPRGGPMVIEVKGTATIENPRCAGQ
jgi:tetratricopeptide (TPR) repeat protein